MLISWRWFPAGRGWVCMDDGAGLCRVPTTQPCSECGAGGAPQHVDMSVLSVWSIHSSTGATEVSADGTRRSVAVGSSTPNVWELSCALWQWWRASCPPARGVGWTECGAALGRSASVLAVRMLPHCSSQCHEDTGAGRCWDVGWGAIQSPARSSGCSHRWVPDLQHPRPPSMQSMATSPDVRHIWWAPKQLREGPICALRNPQLLPQIP